MLGHRIEVEREMYGSGFMGFCNCSDPDWSEGGWSGQVAFYGYTEQEVLDQHHDHLLEVDEVELA